MENSGRAEADRKPGSAPATQAVSEVGSQGDTDAAPVTVYVARWGRGRLGGSGMLLALAQRAMAEGRQVRLLDGDLKSGTLSAYYPSHGTSDGMLDETRLVLCTSPRSNDAADFKAWVISDLERLHADRISRLLDVNGGDSRLEDLMRDLQLPEYCREEGVTFTWLCVLGPDAEDFRHVLRAVDKGDLLPSDMLLIMNEGAIRNGQNPSGAFDTCLRSPDFKALEQAGAKSIYVRRLPCMDPIREGLLDFYTVAGRRPGPNGRPPSPVLAHMTKRWLVSLEAEYFEAGVMSRLP